MNILLLGRNGQVGYRLQRALLCLGSVSAYDRDSYDYQKPDTVLKLVRSAHPDVVINAAAWTAVDLAEKEADATRKVNATTPLAIAEECGRLGSLFVTFSTDYVFGPGEAQPIPESRERAPLNVYGLSKAEMEEGLEHLGIPYLNFRTTWVYDARGKNFLLTMLRLFQEREEVRVVNDQVGAPTAAPSIAAALTLVLTKLSMGSGPWRERCEAVSGHYHLTNGGETNWFDFASKIKTLAVHAGLELKLRNLEGIPSSAYPTPARRPAYSVLDNTKVRETFGLQMPHWEEALSLAFADFLQK